MSGYYLNLDNYCDSLTIPNAATGSSFVTAYYLSLFSVSGTGSNSVNELIWVRTHYLLSFFNSQYGITACNTNYVLAPAASQANTLCVQSSFKSLNVALTASTKFIVNCALYLGRAVGPNSVIFKCSNCTSAFIPKSDGTACVTQINNCEVAQSTTTTLCQICKTGYFNIAGVCGTTSINNCKSHSVSTTPPTNSQTCTNCNSGYILSGDSLSCVLGSIANCAVYPQNTPGTCTSCMQNYVIIALANSVNYCYPLNGLFPNCQLLPTSSQGTGNGFQQATINCVACGDVNGQLTGVVSWSSVATTNQAQTVCIQFQNVQNCVTYQQSQTSYLLIL